MHTLNLEQMLTFANSIKEWNFSWDFNKNDIFCYGEIGLFRTSLFRTSTITIPKNSETYNIVCEFIKPRGNIFLGQYGGNDEKLASFYKGLYKYGKVILQVEQKEAFNYALEVLKRTAKVGN